MNKIGRIKLLPAREQVASILRKAILIGELKEGQEITLESISSQVGVSNMPVREAFQLLETDGLIKLRPNKGAIVLGINEKTIMDHYETRAILESKAASRAARKGTDISNIISIVNEGKKLIEENNFQTYSDNNEKFHTSIWEASDNKKMKRILALLWNGLSVEYNITEEEYSKLSISEHKLILEAIKNNDALAAEELMYNHIIRSMKGILKRFKKI